MAGVRKTEREAALDLLPIWAKTMNEYEREREKGAVDLLLIWAKEIGPNRAHIPDLRSPT